MKTTLLVGNGWLFLMALLMAPVFAQQGAITRGADVKGADVTGGSVNSGTVTPGTVTPGTVTPGTVTTAAGDRQIQVRSADAVSVNVNGADAEVKLGSRSLILEKTQAVLDGKPVGKLPANATKIEVEVKSSHLVIKADGQVVVRVPMK